MGDWSQLPRELLDAIALLLPSDIDVMRFRSVCTSWRSSVSSYPLLYQLPNCVPIHPSSVTINHTTYFSIFFLARRLVVRVSLPQNEQIRNSETSSESWLIKLQPDDDVPNVFHLLNPLNGTPIDPLPTTIPKIFNSMNFQISVLGQEFVLQRRNKLYGSEDLEKIAFSSNPPWAIGHNYVIMTIHVQGYLTLFRSVDNSWTIVDDRLYPWYDVIFYKDEFYVVDLEGRAATVNSSLVVTDIAAPFTSGNKKCLVESNGELLLVDMCTHDFLGDTHDTGISFRVYKLGEGGRQWVEVKSLGDRALFLADNCSFSASARDLSGCKGNCIYYKNKCLAFYRGYDVGTFKNNDLGIFNLESGNIGLLMSHPDHSKLFWPPPAWISTYNNTSGVF